MGQKWSQLDNWCNTSQTSIKTSFLWTIDGFSQLTEETGEELESSTFCAHTDTKTQWYLSLYPNGDIKDNKEFVGLFLNLKESDRK